MKSKIYVVLALSVFVISASGSYAGQGSGGVVTDPNNNGWGDGESSGGTYTSSPGEGNPVIITNPNGSVTLGSQIVVTNNGNGTCTTCTQGIGDSCTIAPCGSNAGGGTVTGGACFPPWQQVGVGCYCNPPYSVVNGQCVLTAANNNSNNSCPLPRQMISGNCQCPNSGDTYNAATNECVAPAALPCPPGWREETIGGAKKCRPIPSSQYQVDSEKYPVCGDGRLPMNYNFQSKKFASSYLPNATTASATVTLSGSSGYRPGAYNYSTPDTENNGLPKYLYSSLTHCGCIGSSVAHNASQALDQAITSGFYPDLFENVSSRGVDGKPNVQVAPIAIAKNSTQDGRDGTIYGSGSRCDCPNINEEIKFDNAGRAYCAPRLSIAQGNVVFKEAFDPVADAAFVLSGAGIQQTFGDDGKIVSQVKLGKIASPEVANANYKRGIWRCEDGFIEVNGVCTFDRSKNQCSAVAPVSPVSEKILAGSNDAERFNRTINKKLACCMNHFKLNSPDPVKFDCIENSSAGSESQSFNELWSKSDSSLDGGQMYAFVMAGANGKPLTGFYRLNGQRCDAYSEFTPYQYGEAKVNPEQRVAQGNFNSGVQSLGDVPQENNFIPQPSGEGKSAMLNGLQAKAKAPRTIGERLECPILVRALTLAKCPENPSGNAPKKTYEERDANGNVIGRRCSVASSIQVRFRVEQVTEIAGSKKLEPMDTVIDKKNVSAVSIDRIIRAKYGSACPPGTTRRGDACVY